MAPAAAVNFAILEWTGTADAPTSDVVNDWTNATFTAGNFFNSTTLTVRKVGTITPGAATLTDFRVSAVLGSSFNNLIVMIWTSGTAAQNSTLDFCAQLKKGFVAHPLDFRSFADDLWLSRRYFNKTYDPATALATVTNLGAQGGVATGTVAQRPFVTWNFNATMRAVPTVTYYSPVTGATGKMANLNTSLDVDANSYTVSMNGLTFYPSGTPSLGDAVFCQIAAAARL